jgi:hypothetical protein
VFALEHTMPNTNRAPHTSPRPWVFAAWAVVSVGVIVQGQSGRDDVLARLGAYVDAWERELGSVVADEAYHQSVVRLPGSSVTRVPNRPPRETRELVSAFTLIHFEGGVADWLGFRSVTRVDGKGVAAPGPSLAELMKDDRLSWQERWKRVRDMNAAFNIGSISRDVNIPTFALAALRTVNHPRFRFSRPRSDTVDGKVLTVLELREQARPTLVSGLRGRDVPLNGKVWLDAREGRVRRTEIRLQDRVLPPPEVGGEHQTRDEELTSRITVVFGPDSNVGTWVPVEMRERYDNSWGEVTTGRATYANYRKFRTTARLVRPGS